MVTVYGKPGCNQCKQTVKHLERKNVAHVYKDISVDDAARERVLELGYVGVPVVEANGEHWYSFDLEKLASLT